MSRKKAALLYDDPPGDGEVFGQHRREGRAGLTEPTARGDPGREPTWPPIAMLRRQKALRRAWSRLSRNRRSAVAWRL